MFTSIRGGPESVSFGFSRRTVGMKLFSTLLGFQEGTAVIFCLAEPDVPAVVLPAQLY